MVEDPFATWGGGGNRPAGAGAEPAKAAPDRLPVSSTVGVEEMPTDTLARSGILAPDYADEFTLRVPGAGTVPAEAWARTMFGDVPNLTERFIFQVLLRLRLARGAGRETVAGFAVTGRSAECIRLEAGSPLLRCHLLVQARGSSVRLATLMVYHRRRGQVTWMLVSAVHRRLAPGLLREAAATVEVVHRG